MRKKLFSMLALLLIAATGAWAQEWTNIIVNSDLEGTDVSCFYKQESNSGIYLCRITDGIGVDGSRGIMVQSQATDEADWWTQFDIRLPYALPAGTQYKLSFDYKADNAGDFKFQTSNEPGQYVWWTLEGWPEPGGSFDTTWKHYEQTFTVLDALDGSQSESGDWLMKFRTIYACLAANQVTTQFIFDNVKVEIPSDVLTTLTPEPVTDPNLMIPYYNDDDVAVGKLEAAIETYDAIASPTADDKATLKAAIDQFKADNADQEKDETAKVNTAGWKTFNGSDASLAPDWAAPAVNTYDKRSAQPAEVYEGSADGVNRTGIIIYQDITGLANGQYKVGFYGTAYYTNGRGFESTMEDGSTDVAYVFANEQKKFITARVGTSFSEYNLLQFNVTVTDGNIKLGLGKEKGGSNWHTMQIYQLTWFATAKEAYAASQTELKALLTDAKALAADETKTEGKDDFNAVIATAEEATTTKADWYNNTEIEAIIADLKTAIANFKKANYFIDLAAGEYYIIEAESGKMMAAGHDWGTRGIVNEMGLDLTLTPNSETRTVTIDSRVSNGGDSHFLGSNLYMDGSAYGWALEYQGFGFYILDPASEKYINIDADNNLVLSDTPREFIIVTAEGVMEQLLGEMADATAENPVDATRLIKANNFNRNDARNAEAWTVEQTLTGDGHSTNLSGGEDGNGNVGNNCAEAYCTPFSFTQTITGAPAGVYQLTAQGFYRQEDYESENPATPQFFANGVEQAVPVWTYNENSMTEAAQSFTAGKYTIDPIEFTVGDDGQIVLGISGTASKQWVCFDNFRLTYLGKLDLALSEETDNTATLEEWDGFEADVTLTRTLQTGGWNTLAVPFSIDAANFAALQTLLTAQGGGITLKQLSSSEFSEGTLTLNFADATSIEAGKPYLAKVSKDLNLATLPAAIATLGGTNPFAGVTISKTLVPTETTYADFVPTLGRTQVTADKESVLFLGANNTLLNPSDDGQYIKGFRAYFQLKGDAVTARSFQLNFGDGETTSINTTNFTNYTNSEELYDLQGRRVNNATKKGVYIVNGKKSIIK